jgi:hypothetical protein
LKAGAGTEEGRLPIEAAQRDPCRFAELFERNFERVYAYIARRADAVYRRARPGAGVRDFSGNPWYIATHTSGINHSLTVAARKRIR